jgi:hypothetical protein
MDSNQTTITVASLEEPDLKGDIIQFEIPSPQQPDSLGK